MNILRRVISRPVAAFAFFILLSCPMVRAQSGPGLLIEPWPKQQAIQADTNAYFFNQGHTKEADAPFRLSMLESDGRIRLFPGNLISPRIGWSFAGLDLETPRSVLPHQLYDASISLGTAVAEYHGWIAGLTMGLGYAGDTPFSQSDAWYGKATFLVGREFSNHDTIGVALDYDGNRSTFPDIPLPGFVYTHRLDPTLLVAAGFPFTSLTWQPNEQFKFDIRWTYVDTFDVSADYEFVKHFNIFGTYGSRLEAFHTDQVSGNNRLLFEQQRAEIGIRLTPNDHLAIATAIGYAFGQEFRTGFDTRDTDGLAKISDEPYLRIGLKLDY